jgi:hypothetical protein
MHPGVPRAAPDEGLVGSRAKAQRQHCQDFDDLASVVRGVTFSCTSAVASSESLYWRIVIHSNKARAKLTAITTPYSQCEGTYSCVAGLGRFANRGEVGCDGPVGARRFTSAFVLNGFAHHVWQ